MPNISIFETIFAVLDETKRESPQLLGTAFSVGNGVFATAGHVVENLQSCKSPTLRQFKNDGTVQVIPIKQSEHWNNIDFGLLLADFFPKEIPSWIDARLAEPTDVYSVGFAYGLDVQRQKLIMRHFKGHIVSCQYYSSWGELDIQRKNEIIVKYPFWTYELSFACPRCQSGAPLIANLPGGISVIGFIVGNSSSSMQVHASTEKISNGNKTERYEMHELLHLGQAITSNSLLNGDSILLGNLGEKEPSNSRKKTLREHIGKAVRQVIVTK